MYFVKNFSYFCNHKGYKHKRIEKAEINFYHLTFVLEGTITYIVNGEKILLQKNDGMLLVPGTIRERFASDGLAHYVIFNFTSNKGTDVPSNMFWKNAVNQTILKLLDSYSYSYYRTADHMHTTTKENAKIYSVLPNIFNCILEEFFSSMKYETQNFHVLNAINYINDNVTKPLSLAKISKNLHLTKEYTANIFKKELNMTVSEYINEQKVLLAKNMLTNSEMSLRDIAYKIGYENYGYFSKVFKKHFGISPLKMKLEMKKK